MAVISINGVDVYYEEQGTGTEVFLIVMHGRNELEFMSLLPPEYHTFRVDLPGYGRSTNLKEFRGFKQWSEDIYNFSQRLGLDKFIYIGYSMTGIVGFQLVLDHPEVVKGFIPLTSIPIPEVPLPGSEEKALMESGDAEAHEAYMEKTFLFPVSTDDKTRLQRRERNRQQRLKNAEKTNTDLSGSLDEQILFTKEGREKTVPRLREIRVPTLLLFGAQDWSNPLVPAITSAMSIPNAKAVFYQDYGHGLPVEGPDKIVDEIVTFVNELNKES